MTVFSHASLQQAIYQKLTADSGLMALIQGVYDRPPQGSSYPYITIGESVIKDWSTKTSSGTEQMVTLRVWSREGGRKQSAEIMKKVHSALHQVNLTVSGHSLVLIQFFSSQLVIENDGSTYQGIMEFRALLQEN